MLFTSTPSMSQRIARVIRLVGSRAGLLLAAPAEVRDPLARRDLRDTMSVPRTGLAALAVHAQVVPVVVRRKPLLLHQRGDDRRRPVHHRMDRTIEFSQLFVRELRPSSVRVYARLPQNLVRVRVANAGDAALRRKHSLHLRALLL